MARDTKGRILAALDMFSLDGYAGTYIRGLAGSLGMGKSSLYRHFESKEEIWNALLDELAGYYEARFGSPERLPPVPDSLEELVSVAMRMVNFTVRGEKVVKPRKLLSIGRFRDGHKGHWGPTQKQCSQLRFPAPETGKTFGHACQPRLKHAWERMLTE